MTNEAWSLATMVIVLLFFVFYLAGLLREQRGRAMVAEQYATDLSAQLTQMMKARTVEWDEDDDSAMSIFVVDADTDATDPADWLELHPGTDPHRERGEK